MTAGLALAGTLAAEGWAAPPPRADGEATRAWGAGGWDPTWVMEVGAGRTVGTDLAEAHAWVAAPVVLVPSFDGLACGLGGDLGAGGGPWRASAGADLRTTYAAGELGTQLGFGVDAWARAGATLGPAVQWHLPLFRDAELVAVEDAGHRLFVERWDAVIGPIEAFLAPP